MAVSVHGSAVIPECRELYARRLYSSRLCYIFSPTRLGPGRSVFIERASISDRGHATLLWFSFDGAGSTHTTQVTASAIRVLFRHTRQRVVVHVATRHSNTTPLGPGRVSAMPPSIPPHTPGSATRHRPPTRRATLLQARDAALPDGGARRASAQPTYSQLHLRQTTRPGRAPRVYRL